MLNTFGIVACHSPNCYNFGICASIFLVFFLKLTFLCFYLYCGGSESQSQCCLAKVANYTVYISFRTLCKLELYWWKFLLVLCYVGIDMQRFGCQILFCTFVFIWNILVFAQSQLRQRIRFWLWVKLIFIST